MCRVNPWTGVLGLWFLLGGCGSGVAYKATCQLGGSDCFAGYTCATEPSTSQDICFTACAIAADCVGSQTCDQIDLVCRAKCTGNQDCIDTLICDIPAGELVGVCRVAP